MAEDTTEFGGWLKQPTAEQQRQREAANREAEEKWQERDQSPEKSLEGFRKTYGREPTDAERKEGLGLAPRELATDRKLHAVGIGPLDGILSVFGSGSREMNAKFARIKQELNQEFGPVQSVGPTSIPSVTETPPPAATQATTSTPGPQV